MLRNAKILGKTLQNRGYDILTGGTVNHMILLDLRRKNITGKEAALQLDKAAITLNKNTVPFDDKSPFITSGLRLGTAACTTRGFKETEFVQVGDFIADILDAIKEKNIEEIRPLIYSKSTQLIDKYPL